VLHQVLKGVVPEAGLHNPDPHPSLLYSISLVIPTSIQHTYLTINLNHLLSIYMHANVVLSGYIYVVRAYPIYLYMNVFLRDFTVVVVTFLLLVLYRINVVLVFNVSLINP